MAYNHFFRPLPVYGATYQPNAGLATKWEIAWRYYGRFAFLQWAACATIARATLTRVCLGDSELKRIPACVVVTSRWHIRVG